MKERRRAWGEERVREVLGRVGVPHALRRESNTQTPISRLVAIVFLYGATMNRERSGCG
jgi:hypothetical protein